MDRQIHEIQRKEEDVKRSLKEANEKGDKDVCLTLEKALSHAREAISQINTSKAHINSIAMQLKNQAATLRLAGSLQKSTEVMKAMSQLIKVPEVAATMRDLSKEMMKVKSKVTKNAVNFKLVYLLNPGWNY